VTAWAAANLGFTHGLADRSRGSASSGTGGLSLVPRRDRLIVSAPATTKVWPSPARIACIAIRMPCRLDAQYRVTVVPGTVSHPSSTATTRAMLKPCSPPGAPQPTIRSLAVDGSSCGTCCTAALIAATHRSSARSVVSDPL